ncbi:hypothetical protein KUTeg_024461 [Tegillarca granosa]|uniref:Coronin n=1 Tax=Tegillarca granosa TaxID=220873 RepID=A0ABQ9E327_TEGGR|nr:hypothetical protein KUTeg_024461 [Tegillarca granosa]
MPIGTLMASCGNHIKAGCVYMAFNVASSDFVMDFDFSPFDDYLLATGSADCGINIWLLPTVDNIDTELSCLNPAIALPGQDRRIENVLWNPVAETLSGPTDQLQSVSWKGDGSSLVTSCKDKIVRIFDPRSGEVVQEGEGHQSLKDSRAIWLGEKDFILTAGCNQTHEREMKYWDCRNLKSPIVTSGIDGSSGSMIPLYDRDTGMLFILGKGDTSIKYYEILDKAPHIQQNYVDRTEQARGGTLLPKHVLEVMDGEVDRLLVLTNNNIIPIPYIIPRKSYRDFLDDVFPDTPSREPALKPNEWKAGKNSSPLLSSLNPAKRSEIQEPAQIVETTPSIPVVSDQTPATDDVKHNNETDEDKLKDTETPSVDSRPKENTTPSAKQQKNIFTSVRQSKFKHLSCKVQHKSKHIDNIRRLSTRVPGESDMFHVNSKRCVIPIDGAGGLLAVLELNKPGRLPDTGVPVLQHGSKVTDYVFDPFNDNRLVVVCDDAKIHVWDLPDNGVTETMTGSSFYLLGHTEKIYFAKFHPLAKDILVTSAYDMSVRIWDLSEKTEKIQLEPHPDQVFCAAWSPDGKYLATVCKDGKIRIFNVRKSASPLVEGQGPEGSRGARIVWALDGQYLVVSGFNSLSTRTVSVYDTADLTSPLYISELDTSPAILVPFYDEDSSTLLLTGRGDSTIVAFEVAEEEPYLFKLSTSNPEGVHQAVAYLPKKYCNVKDVEFAIGYRLTNNTIEPVSFTLPRVKKEYFQDDIYPDTKVTWEPVMSSQEWFSGMNKIQRKISLKPKDMISLSEAPTEAPKVRKYDSYNPETYKTDEQKKEELISAMTNKLTVQEDPLPQDIAEGVDSDEWEDY